MVFPSEMSKHCWVPLGGNLRLNACLTSSQPFYLFHFIPNRCEKVDILDWLWHGNMLNCYSLCLPWQKAVIFHSDVHFCPPPHLPCFRHHTEVCNMPESLLDETRQPGDGFFPTVSQSPYLNYYFVNPVSVRDETDNGSQEVPLSLA